MPNDLDDLEAEYLRQYDAYLDRWAGELRQALGDGSGAVAAQAKAAGTELPPPHTLLGVQDIAQPDSWSCGACAAMAVGRYFGLGSQELDDWKKALGTSEKASTDPDRIIAYLRELGLDAVGRHEMTLDDLDACWRDRRPVICMVREYGTEAKPTSEKYGHYVVFIGINLGLVVVMDPSIDNVLKDQGVNAARGLVVLEEERWLGVWHDTDEEGRTYVRYGIVVGPAGEDAGEPRAKAAGSCKPGERADLTGCTPVGGDPGAGQHVHSARKPMSVLSRPRSRLGSTAGASSLPKPVPSAAGPASPHPQAIPLEPPKPADLKTAAKEVAAALGKALWAKVPPAARPALAGAFHLVKQAEHHLQSYCRAGQELAKAVAAEQGLPPERVESLGRLLGAADFVGRWSLGFPVHSVLGSALTVLGGPVAVPALAGAKLTYYLPAASLAYVGGALLHGAAKGKNPFTTLKAARARVKAVLAKGGHKHAGRVVMKATPEEAAELARRLKDAADPDEYAALVAAALDEMGGDLGRALEVADAVAKEGPLEEDDGQ